MSIDVLRTQNILNFIYWWCLYEIQYIFLNIQLSLLIFYWSRSKKQSLKRDNSGFFLSGVKSGIHSNFVATNVTNKLTNWGRSEPAISVFFEAKLQLMKSGHFEESIERYKHFPAGKAGKKYSNIAYT